MSKSKKVLWIVVICVLVLFGGIYWAVEKIMTANISKATIIEKLEAATGYHVAIEGDLHWQYSLRPNLNLDEIIFTSKTNQAAIDLKKVRISMALVPLLQKRVFVDLNFQNWKQNQLHFSNGHAHVEYKNNIINLTDFNAGFYQGNIQGHASIDLNNPTPEFKIILNANEVEIGALLADIAQSASVSGKMNGTTTLTSEGENAEQFIKNLNGNLSLNIANGKLHTIHLGKVLPNIPVNNEDFFDTLTITAPINHGIADATMTLLAKNYHADGKGEIDLNNQTLNIKLNAFYTRSIQTKNIAIPITISGTISSPNVSVDLAKPLGELLNSNGIKIKNKLNILIQGL